MSLPVLLLLSLLPVRCGGCNYEWEVVTRVKKTIDTNPNGFRTVFPKDYNVVHHYRKTMLCDTDPCCVFPAAIVLMDSWNVLLRNLWHEHLNRSLIYDLRRTLNKIISKNENSRRFQEETDLEQFSKQTSSPEDLLNFTSELFGRFLKVGCNESITSCPLPTLPPSIERKDYGPSRMRLLTTRAISSEEKRQPEKRIDVTQPPSNGAALPTAYYTSVWSPLLFRLYWWFWP